MNSPLVCLFVAAYFCLASTVRSEAPPVSVPFPGGIEVPARLNVTDESGESWKSLPVTLEPSTNGFSATFVTPAGSTTVEGIFEVQGQSVRCSVKWQGSEELPGTFMMLVLMIPLDEAAEALVTSQQGSISVPKMLSGESGSSSFEQTNSFVMGPVGGREITFSSDSAMDIGVVLSELKDSVHLRLGLTPHKTALPVSGEVVWTMGE